MKKLLLIVSILFFCSYCTAQIPDTIETRLKSMILADNQFFNYSNDSTIALTTIVAERSLKKIDSLKNESDYLHKEVVKAIGKEGVSTDIIYTGQHTDKNKIIFSYFHNKYQGLNIASYESFNDTLLATDNIVRERLADLRGHAFVRHRLGRDGLSIIFGMIVKDISKITKRSADTEALKLVLQYLDVQFCEYSHLKIEYIEQYSNTSFLHDVKVNNLIISKLSDYYYEKKGGLQK